MGHFRRRDIFTLSSALLATQAWAQEPASQAKLAPPSRPPKQLPRTWIDAETIPLWPAEPPGAISFAPQVLPDDWTPAFVRNVAKPHLRVFRSRKPNGQALLVLPGGAYWFVSVANEGAQLAERMTELGVTVFVLTYRLPSEGWASRSDVPLQDAQRAMRVIRSHAARFGVDPDTLTVLGFSAGGHLAATLATQHSEQVYSPADAADRLNPRPFAAALVYPVVTMKRPWTHDMSRKLLLGEAPTDAQVAHRSAELHVDAVTPPLFIVHAMDDEAVPVENSLQMTEAMRAAKRPIETHLLQEGGHAFGVGYPNTPSGHWIVLFHTWLNTLNSKTRRG